MRHKEPAKLSSIRPSRRADGGARPPFGPERLHLGALGGTRAGRLISSRTPTCGGSAGGSHVDDRNQDHGIEDRTSPDLCRLWRRRIGDPASSQFQTEVARPERFELPAPRFVVWCSIQLSYGRVPSRRAQNLLRPLYKGKRKPCFDRDLTPLAILKAL